MKRCRAPACGKVIEAEAAVTAGFPGERWTSKQSWRGDDCGFPGEDGHPIQAKHVYGEEVIVSL